MTTPMYEKEDAEILGKIREGHHTFGVLELETGLPMRVVDRRLQAMRKRGVIEYRGAKAGWFEVTK